VTGGGPAPFIATALLARAGSGYAIAGYIAVCAIVGIIATMLMPDRTNRDISQKHADKRRADAEITQSHAQNSENASALPSNRARSGDNLPMAPGPGKRADRAPK